MKEIKAIIRPHRLDAILDALHTGHAGDGKIAIMTFAKSSRYRPVHAAHVLTDMLLGGFI